MPFQQYLFIKTEFDMDGFCFMFVGYSMPNYVFSYILDMICKHILLISFLAEPELIYNP